MNYTTITGNLGKDPVVRATSTGKAVAMFSVANSRKDDKAEGGFATTWVNVVAWNALAESVGNQLKKGERVIVSGYLQVRSYQDKQGQTKYATEIVATEIGVTLSKKQQYGPPPQDGNFAQFGQRAGWGGFGAKPPQEQPEQNIPF